MEHPDEFLGHSCSFHTYRAVNLLENGLQTSVFFPTYVFVLENFFSTEILISNFFLLHFLASPNDCCWLIACESALPGFVCLWKRGCTEGSGESHVLRKETDPQE